MSSKRQRRHAYLTMLNKAEIYGQQAGRLKLPKSFCPYGHRGFAKQQRESWLCGWKETSPPKKPTLEEIVEQIRDS